MLFPTTSIHCRGVCARSSLRKQLSIVYMRRTRSHTHVASNLSIFRKHFPTFTGNCSCREQRVFKGSAQRQPARSIHPCFLTTIAGVLSASNSLATEHRPYARDTLTYSRSVLICR